MDSFVKHVFTFLLWVTVAWILYLALFGTYSLQGVDLTGDTAYTGNTTQQSPWKGVLWNAAIAVESPIAHYYYQFCYLPNVHAGDYVDAAIGMHPNTSHTVSVTGGRINLFETVTDLSGVSDMYDVDSHVASTYNAWSTGWVS